MTRAGWKEYVMNFFEENINPRFSRGVWASFPSLGALCDPDLCYGHKEDFTSFPSTVTGTTLAGYTVTKATEGAVSLADSPGGVLLLDSASSTQGQGVQAQKDEAVFKCDDEKPLFFEARFKITDTVDKAQIFIGLAEKDTTLMPGGDLDKTNSDYIGFGIETTGAGVLKAYSCKDGTENSVVVAELEEDTFVKVGFIVSSGAMRFFVNGTEVASTSVTVVPTNVLAPSFVCQSDGTADPVLGLDYFVVRQIR